MKISNLDDVKKILENHEKRILTLEKKKTIKGEDKIKNWYKKGSTIEKIISLINERFFNKPRNIKEIILEFKTRDYHLKTSDITLPLRKIVRKGLLKKTKKYQDGTISKKWLYVKV